ncbi:MAG: hypothetical protein WCI67_03420 [Chloroflexales bacterium]
MKMESSLPDSCIRGPELRDPQAIQEQIAQQDGAALEIYGAGIALVQRVWQLLPLQQRLHERQAARTFLLHQLRVIEQQAPQVVSTALACFDQQQRQGQVPISVPTEDTADLG